MLKVKRIVYSAGIVVLALAMLFGCARLFWDTSQQSGWYIQLNVGNPGAKGVGVVEYEVTGLSIAVYDPEDQLLDSFNWDAADGAKSYSVQVNQAGTHRIEVIHISEENGEPVEASESAEFDIKPMVITVIDITPGAVGLIRVDGGTVEPIPMTGYWDAYLTPTGGETQPPHLLYIKQTDSLLDAFEVTGSVDGQAVALTLDDGSGTFTGTVVSNELVSGDFEWEGQPGTFDLIRSDLLFGPFQLEGMTNVNTLEGLGYQGEDRIWYRLDFQMRAGMLEGGFAFENNTGLATGTYSVISREGPDPGPTEVIGWFFENWQMDYPVEFGVLVINQYDPAYVAGTFSLQFEEGNYLNGYFELSGAMHDAGVVGITAGFWNGETVAPETAGGMIWYAGMDQEWASCEIQSLNEDRDVWLVLSPQSGPLHAGTFSVPEQVWIGVSDQYDDGLEVEEEAESGTLVITSFQDNVGMAGYFDNMIFSGGTLSGSFDVSFQSTAYE
jgi:hypothetical protein